MTSINSFRTTISSSGHRHQMVPVTNHPRFLVSMILTMTAIVSTKSAQGDVQPDGSARNSSVRPNVLMIIVDDLRPELGAYYDIRNPGTIFPRIQTPSMNSLASRSLLLKNAFVQQAICAPSRVSLLTSRRPDTTHVYTIQDTYWRKVSGDLVTIPQFFKNNGYRSVGIGKVFHHGSGSNQDDPPSWSEDYHSVPKDAKSHYSDRTHSWRAVTPEERLERPLPDDYVAGKAIEVLGELGPGSLDGRAPFFMAVGFYKPHLPFVFPQQYLGLYPLETIPVPRHSEAPQRMPDIAWNNWEIRKYPDIAGLNIPDEIGIPLPVNVTRDLRRAYYSAVSYIDDLIGRILWQLDRTGLGNSTIVALLGDHGWHLGEGNLWGKHTNFELSTRAPLIIRVPGLTDGGLVHEKPVEFVDIFPTLVDAAGFDPLPVCPLDSSRTALCTEGSSLFDLMKRSSGGSGAPSRKEVAFSQYPRRGFSVMGYSIRTDKFRYTEWIRRWKHHTNRDPHRDPNRDPHRDPTSPPRLRIVHAVELYDHRHDPDETINVADRPSYARLQGHLSRALQAGWRWALTGNDTTGAVPPSGLRVRRITLRPPRT